MKLTIILSTLSLICSPIAFADHHAKAESAEKPEAPAKAADVKLVIECNDQMQFDKKEFEVTAGQVVELTLKNIGKLPKIAMGHNLVILAAGVEPPKYAIAAMQAKETEYVLTDEANKEKVIAYTKVLGPGEETTITFTAPAAGTYDYLCTFPGHFGVMKGKMIVK